MVWVCPQDLKPLVTYTLKLSFQLGNFQCMPYNNFYTRWWPWISLHIIFEKIICKDRTISKGSGVSYKCDGTYIILYNS